MKLTETFKETNIEEAIAGSIASYFDTMNVGDFEATAALFAEEGKLCPPFEKAIVGREAIAQYLKTEAKGMKLQVDRSISTRSNENVVEVISNGKVFTSLFSVNVAWQFSLNNVDKIMAVKIDLLASAQELLNLKQELK
jgi:Nuclear transport factor 2 (NTF2) domain